MNVKEMRDLAIANGIGLTKNGKMIPKKDLSKILLDQNLITPAQLKKTTRKTVKKSTKKAVRKSSKKSGKYDSIIVPKFKKEIGELTLKELRDYAQDIKIPNRSKCKRKADWEKLVGEFLNEVKDDDAEDLEEDLSKKTVKQLRELLAQKGIKSGTSGKKKADLIEMLNCKQCDPVKEIHCEDDEVCDIRNKICVPKAEADKRGIKSMTYKGQTIIGSQKSIDALKLKLKEKEEEEEEIIDSGDEIIEEDDLEEEEKDEEIDSGDEIIEEDDLEDEIAAAPPAGIVDVLDEIEEKSSEDLSNITDVQKEVLKCLGMIA